MSSTVKLQDSINWAQPFLGYAPLAIGLNNEPAITAANTIMQTILSPPFQWRWNRKIATFNTIASPPTQDYSVAISNYGNFELGSVASPGSLTYPLEYKSLLDIAVEQSRPSFISDQLDDDNGNITFRVQPVPDQIYNMTVAFQAASPSFTSLAQTWNPIPDWMEFVYNWGFLSIMSDFVDQSKAPRFRQLFVASLLSVSEGLSEQDKNLFIASWLGEQRQESGNMQKSQVGWKGRAV
jgi:hypothetical protein